jgi:hypothetical protein
VTKVAGFLLIGLSLLFTGGTAEAADAVSAKAFILHKTVVVTLGNTSTGPLSEVSVELWGPTRRLATSSRLRLAVGGSAVVRLVLRTDDSVYLVVRAVAANVSQEFAVPLPRRSSSGLSLDAAPMLGLIGVVVGVLLTHWTNARREHERARFESAQRNIERFAPSYRDFLKSWNRSLSSQHLETEFATLGSKIPIPDETRTKIKITLTILSDPHQPRAKKQAAADALFEHVDALTHATT